MKNLLYIVSLIIIATSIITIIEYPNSGKMQLLAGGLVFLGFVFNISGFSLKDKK